jgi:hypothetical protein
VVKRGFRHRIFSTEEYGFRRTGCADRRSRDRG